MRSTIWGWGPREGDRSDVRAGLVRVLHLAATDGAGGADRAAFRVHRAVGQVSGVDSEMLVSRSITDDPSVNKIENSKPASTLLPFARRLLKYEKRFLLRSPNAILHSTARVPTAAPRAIQRIDPDVVLLHWLGNEVLSIAQIGRLAAKRRSVAWLLHDTWAFSGAEHYPHGEADRRFIDGYRKGNRLDGERGPDLNLSVWERKRRHWIHPLQIIVPSRWMADQVRRSALMHDWPVQVIPYPLDTAWWGGLSREEARERLGIPAERRIVLFGAVGGERDPRKGADLLHDAIPHVAARYAASHSRPLELLTFGGPEGEGRVADVPVRSVGRLDDEGLRLYYSAADVMVVPSRQEAFGQTASESITCGTPVVAFSVGGLPDIVEDRVTGRLVEPFSPEALAEGIGWCIEDDERHQRLSEAARNSARRWASGRIGRRYAEVLSGLRHGDA